MTVRRLTDVVLQGLDNAWAPLVERTAGLTDAEFLWEPVVGCWSVHPDEWGGWSADWADPDPVPAPVTTIAWRTWHIAVDALDSYSDRLFGLTGSGLSGATWVGTWATARELLDASWAVFRAGVADWGDEWFAALGPAWGPFGEQSRLDLVMHAQREVIHHGAEIALLRDLYAARA